MEGSASTSTKENPDKTEPTNKDVVLSQISLTAGSLASAENIKTHNPATLSNKLLEELTNRISRTLCANIYCSSRGAECGVQFGPATWICCRCVVVGVLLLKERKKRLDVSRESKKRKRTDEVDPEIAESESPRTVRNISETERVAVE